MNRSSEFSLLIDTLQAVSRGKLSLDDFYARRKLIEKQVGNDSITVIMNDAEDAVVHLPAEPISGRVRLDEMLETFEGGMLPVYIILLTNSIALERAVELREVLYNSDTTPTVALTILKVIFRSKPN